MTDKFWSKSEGDEFNSSSCMCVQFNSLSNYTHSLANTFFKVFLFLMMDNCKSALSVSVPLTTWRRSGLPNLNMTERDDHMKSDLVIRTTYFGMKCSEKIGTSFKYGSI